MTRYVGTGVGAWRGDWYVYRPSEGDRRLARELGEATAKRVERDRRKRTGYGASSEVRVSWYVSGFLGEVAGLNPIPTGPDLDAWNGRGWFGAPDFGRLEIRTTSHWQLYGFALRGSSTSGLGGWRITAKDSGRIIVAVQERNEDFVVMGYREADDVPRLDVPLGPIVAILEPPELRTAWELFHPNGVTP
jgi:hypothetical protein